VAPAASEPSAGYSIYEALEKQLGIKFQKQKRPAQVIVVDHIEQTPTPGLAIRGLYTVGREALDLKAGVAFVEHRSNAEEQKSKFSRLSAIRTGEYQRIPQRHAVRPRTFNLQIEILAVDPFTLAIEL